ncbi:DNA primase [Nitrosomonas supralitoralis]|uniref:DNA primase n=1 Tax=Nitrosomonas supralitoralis TaxID=2116706 RepID=A0A2P7NRE6_9PROT|nr:DNA primase [Nitrosomonas supralitoralis]PSJ16035.1 DNA primase [Nitrosomonas supralitoralis]
MIPQPFIHELLNRVDIVDTIDRHVPLKKAGANFVACCPFHSEKTPSFTVSQPKQFYHCFGCGAHGNVISFLMEYSGLSFVDAVNDLASYVGMQLPIQQTDMPSSSVVPDDSANYFANDHYISNPEISSQDLLNVMQVATRFYREQLKISEKAVAYLKMRGLSGKTAARFAIGYAPTGWQNLELVFSDYRSEKTRNLLVQAGLVVVGNEAKQYDRFRNRIMFPILNQKGQIIGFGGRVLDDEEPKYLNSPETILFEKGRELYNFFSARRAIREADCALVVEGYMDAISLSQHGIDYVVASLGTATTSFHLQKLLRQTDQIIFCFDGDKAGRKAAWRALENSLALLTDGKFMSFLFLPEGLDPDSYVKRNGKESFEEQLKQSIPLSEFLFKELCSRINIQTSEGRAKLVNDAKPLLQRVTAPALLLILLRRLAELSGLSQSEVEELLQIKPSYKKYTVKKILRKQPVTPYRWLIMMLLHNPSYINRIDRSLLSGEKENSEEISALETLIELFDKYPHLTNSETQVSTIVVYLQDSSHRTLLENIESETLKWNDINALEKEFLGALEILQQAQRKKRITELYSKSLNMLTDDEKRELQQLAMR